MLISLSGGNEKRITDLGCWSLQFLCLKNIRTFLTSCNVVFSMKKIDLFDAFDLFDVRDFGKVTAPAVFLSSLSFSSDGGLEFVRIILAGSAV